MKTFVFILLATAMLTSCATIFAPPGNEFIVYSNNLESITDTAGNNIELQRFSDGSNLVVLPDRDIVESDLILNTSHGSMLLNTQKEFMPNWLIADLIYFWPGTVLDLMSNQWTRFDDYELITVNSDKIDYSRHPLYDCSSRYDTLDRIFNHQSSFLELYIPTLVAYNAAFYIPMLFLDRTNSMNDFYDFLAYTAFGLTVTSPLVASATISIIGYANNDHGSFISAYTGIMAGYAISYLPVLLMMDSFESSNMGAYLTLGLLSTVPPLIATLMYMSSRPQVVFAEYSGNMGALMHFNNKSESFSLGLPMISFAQNPFIIDSFSPIPKVDLLRINF